MNSWFCFVIHGREIMQESQSGQVERALRLQAGRVGFEAVVPNPKLKLLEQVREVMRLRHYSIRTEQSGKCHSSLLTPRHHRTALRWLRGTGCANCAARLPTTNFLNRCQ